MELNNDVTLFLDGLQHRYRQEIELLRNIILRSDNNLSENVKWNAPNYSYNNEDRITMKIMPPTKIQLVFHRGAKKIEMPKQKLIDNDFGLLVWKENDRAIATFNTMNDIERQETAISQIVKSWIEAAK